LLPAVVIESTFDVDASAAITALHDEEVFRLSFGKV
jgi:hypothetical protein